MVQTRIDTPKDPRIAVYLGLRDQVARQRREQAGGDMAGYFIAEGDLVIERALTNGHELHSILVPESRNRPLPIGVTDDVDVFLANDLVLNEITGRPKLRDTLSCFVRPAPARVAEILESATTLAVLENINNPNNLGVIIRNAAGLGIDAVLLDPRCGDPLYRRAIRASMGQVFSIPHARIDHLPSGLDLLHQEGFHTIALTPSGVTELRDIPAIGEGRKIAVLLGAEGPGLDSQTLSAASSRARISMANDVDSLNVANAAAIAFWHFGTPR